MAERTDEQVREDPSEPDTEELLAEVESLTGTTTDRETTTGGADRETDPFDADSASLDRATTDERAVDERGRVSGLRERAGDLFSVRGFLVALAVSAIGLVIGGLVPLLPMSGAIGLFGAAFALGVGSGEQRYVETGLAGALALGASTFFEYLRFSMFAGAGFAPALLGVGVGLVLGVLGYYFGRDLRGGLTQEL